MHPVLKQMLPATAPQQQQREQKRHEPAVPPPPASLDRDVQGRWVKRSAPVAPEPRPTSTAASGSHGVRWRNDYLTEEPLQGGGGVGGGETSAGYRRALDWDEGEGLARPLPPTRGPGELDRAVARHPRVALKRDTQVSDVAPDNLFREDLSGGVGEREGLRDLQYRAGHEILESGLDRERVLSGYDFEQPVDGGRAGPSSGHAHVRAADLATAYQQTVRQERSFQQTFNHTLRTLLAREETRVGLMHLWDFAQALRDNPQSRALTAQLFLITQHCRDEGVFREALLGLAEPESRWLFDLLDILQSIVVQEQRLTTEERVAAINYAVLTLGKFYARRVYRTRFVPLDKEVKVDTFYMRMVLKALVLSEELGAYRNARLERQVGGGRDRREMTDAELMQRLRDTLRDERRWGALGGGGATSLPALMPGEGAEGCRPPAPRTVSRQATAAAMHGGAEHLYEASDRRLGDVDDGDGESGEDEDEDEAEEAGAEDYYY